MWKAYAKYSQTKRYFENDGKTWQHFWDLKIILYILIAVICMKCAPGKYKCEKDRRKN